MSLTEGDGPESAEQEERRAWTRPDPVGRSTALPAVSMGFALLLATGFIWIGQWKAEKEAEYTALVTRLGRLESRFDRYSGGDGSNTEDIEELERLLLALEKELTEALDRPIGR